MRLSVNTAQDIPDHFIAEPPAKEISLELRALLEICRIRVESALPDNRADCLRFHVGTLFFLLRKSSADRLAVHALSQKLAFDLSEAFLR